MANFSTIDTTNQNIPFSGSTPDDNALNLTNPDSVLSGTMRGSQNIGSPNIVSNPATTQILVNDNIVNRVAFGKIGSSVNSWGLKVSQPGVDVNTATNSQLIFNSSQDTFKIFGKFTATTTAFNSSCLAGNTNLQVQNDIFNFKNIGFIPSVLATYVDGSGNTPFPSTTYQANLGADNQQWVSSTTSVLSTSSSITVTTAVFMSCIGSTNSISASNPSSQVFIYLLQESATF